MFAVAGLIALAATAVAGPHPDSARPSDPSQVRRSLLPACSKTKPAGCGFARHRPEILDAFPEPLLFWHGYYAEAIEVRRGRGRQGSGTRCRLAPIPVEQWAPVSTNASRRLCWLPRHPCPSFAATPPALSNQRQWCRSTWPLPRWTRWPTSICAPTRTISFAPSALRLRRRQIPPARDGCEVCRPLAQPAQPAMLIRYAGPAGTFPRVSLSDFVTAARAGKSGVLRQWVSGKAVLLSST